MAECIADVDCSLEMAKDRLLAEMAKGITPTNQLNGPQNRAEFHAGMYMFGFGASAGGSTPSGAYSSAALSVIPNADGGVYRSAGLSQYSGSIVNRPTFFAFARGAAVMGEAGPEAILPLRRGTDGKLGVVAAGSGGMAMFAPQYHIAISNTGPELTPQALKAVYDLGKKAAADFVQQQGRDGGRLSGAYR